MNTLMNNRLTAILMTLACLAACSESTEQAAMQDEARTMTTTATADTVAANPFFAESPLPLQFPPFDLITTDHYLPVSIS